MRASPFNLYPHLFQPPRSPSLKKKQPTLFHPTKNNHVYTHGDLSRYIIIIIIINFLKQISYT